MAEAGELFARALAAKPGEAAFHFNYATYWRQLEQWEKALEVVQRALALRPYFPEALLSLAEIRLKLGDQDAADQAARQALLVKPTNSGAYLVLARCALQRGDTARASTYYQQARTLRPDLAQALEHAAAKFTAAFDMDAAIDKYRELVLVEPAQAAHQRNLGALLAKRRDYDAALAALRTALQLDAANAQTHINLAMVLQKTGQIDAAITHYRAALALQPAWDEPRYGLAMLTGENTPSAMPATWIARLFDDYADTFDTHLTDKLAYQTPQLLLAAVQECPATAPAATGRLQIMDLGCGTGLCGPLFKPLADRLVGVDLAPRMIAKARARGVYDELHVAEATAALRQRRGEWDLIIAADVLLYFGDLDGLLVAATAALRPGGRLAFSIETHAGPGYRLNPSGRYAHSRAYIRQLAQAHALTVRHEAPVTLRQENEQPVPGLIFVLQR